MSNKENVHGSKPGDTSTVTASKSIQPKAALIPLLVVFILGILCLQAFNLVFPQIGTELGAPHLAPLITAIPGVILGIVCFIYGSLGDFVSLKKMTIIGVVLLLAGSLLGFFFHGSIWLVIIARAVQTAGAQVAGSVYLVIAAKYLQDSQKVVYFGIFTAGYQLSTAIGVLAGGFLSTIDWSYLFLIPMLSILVLPMILRNLPEVQPGNIRIDVLGFVIFGGAIGLLTLFFSSYNWAILGASVLFFIAFAFYINRAKQPFITPKFFRNTKWIMAISLIFIFYFVNYSLAPIINGIGNSIYGLNSAQVSLYLVWAYLVATVVATSSGIIVARIGRSASIITASILMILGLISSALAVNAGMSVLAVTICFFFAGQGLMYSPLVATVLGTVPADQSGRGIGMNDLVMNVTSSIGIAIFGGLMASQTLAAVSIIGATGPAAVYSNLLVIPALIAGFGFVYYLIIRKRIVGPTG